jgi:hypothetical protein
MKEMQRNHSRRLCLKKEGILIMAKPMPAWRRVRQVFGAGLHQFLTLKPFIQWIRIEAARAD